MSCNPPDLAFPDSPVAASALVKALDPASLHGVVHPLGFFCVTIPAGERRSLRLHVWPALAEGESRAHGPVHEHVWHLKSLVLAGHLVDCRYEVTPDPAGDYRVFDAVCQGDVNDLFPRAERVRLTLVSKRKIVAGETYEVPVGQLHNTLVPGRGLTATLVEATYSDQPAPRIIRPERAPAVTPHVRPRLSPEQLREILALF